MRLFERKFSKGGHPCDDIEKGGQRIRAVLQLSRGGVLMTRRALAVPLVVLASAIVVGPASAKHGRAAKGGDRLLPLLTGLVPVNGGPLGSCPGSAALIVYAQFLVPPRVEV